MHYTNKHKKYHIKSKHNKTNKKHLAKSKKSKKYNKIKKQVGGYDSMSLTNNPLIWTLQDVGSYLMNTLSGTNVPLGSNPTNQLI